MSQTAQISDVAHEQLHLATFYVADLCLALEIGQIQEIIRLVNVTPVPKAPAEVKGVINLRGEVTTVVDLRCVLGLPTVELHADMRTLIVRSQGESIGLIVDRVGNITAVEQTSVMPSPPMLAKSMESFSAAFARESEIIIGAGFGSGTVKVSFAAQLVSVETQLLSLAHTLTYSLAI